MKRAIVTGANGFIGSQLVIELQSSGWAVTAVSRQSTDAINGYAIAPDQWNVPSFVKMIDDIQPDVIFHIVGTIHANLASDLYATNTLMTARLLDAVAASRKRPAVILAGSAAEYGVVASDRQPVQETEPCNPRTDYAISKYAQTLLAQAHALRGTKVTIARIFNPVGPGMPEQLALANFAAQIRNQRNPDFNQLHVGNLAAERDFMDVRDAARCIAGLANTPWAGEVVNICSGHSYCLADLVANLIQLSGRRIDLVVDPARYRPSDMPRFVGSPKRLLTLGLQVPAPNFDIILPMMLAKT